MKLNKMSLCRATPTSARPAAPLAEIHILHGESKYLLLRFSGNISPITEYFKITFYTLIACSYLGTVTKFYSIISNRDNVRQY